MPAASGCDVVNVLVADEVTGVGLPDVGLVLYNTQRALLPKLPPFTVNVSVLFVPEHTGLADGLTDTDDAAVDDEPTVQYAYR